MSIKTRTEDQPSINLTPMVDVVFLLVIFFMVGTKFAEMERKITLEVPAVSDAARLPAAPEKLIVNVYRDGRVSLDRQVVTLEELQSRLAAARSQYRDLGVLIRGDAQGTFQTVADVLAACKSAGISQLGISVRLGARDG